MDDEAIRDPDLVHLSDLRQAYIEESKQRNQQWSCRLEPTRSRG
jgi:hypothetical protein